MTSASWLSGNIHCQMTSEGFKAQKILYIRDPLCKNQAKVSKSNSEITSIKVWLQTFISLWFQFLTWPYSVNIKDTKNIFSQNVQYLQYVEWFYAENSKSKKMTLAVFSQRVTYMFKEYILVLSKNESWLITSQIKVLYAFSVEHTICL